MLLIRAQWSGAVRHGLGPAMCAVAAPEGADRLAVCQVAARKKKAATRTTTRIMTATATRDIGTPPTVAITDTATTTQMMITGTGTGTATTSTEPTPMTTGAMDTGTATIMGRVAITTATTLASADCSLPC